MQLNKSERSNNRKNFSRPKTFIAKDEDNDIESIKNSILRIKEKAFSTEEPAPKSKSGKRSPKFTDYSVQAFVSVSSVNLGNVKGVKAETDESIDKYSLAQNIPKFSLHRNDHSGNINESEVSNLSSKEPESHHPINVKEDMSRGVRKMHTIEDEQNDNNSDLLREDDDIEVKSKPNSKTKSNKLLKYSGDLKSTSLTQNQKIKMSKDASNVDKKSRTVRFKEESDHQRQKSGYDFLCGF